MNNKHWVAALVLGLSVLVSAGASLSQTEAQEELVFTVEQSRQETYSPGGQLERVAIGNPEIADVTVIRGRDVLITGKRRGSTNLRIWRKGNAQPQEYRVVVAPSNNPIPPAVDVQVQTDIKVAQINRSTVKQFGFNFLKGSGNTTLTISPPGSINGINPSGGLSSASGFLPLQNAFQLAIGDPSKSVLGILSLLESRGLVRTLAEPSLVAKSGQTATFLAGGEFPIPVVQGGSGGSGSSVSIEFKEFGVRLQLTPTVLNRKRIVLKVAPEVSDLDFANGVTTGGFTVPALTVRRTDTTVELGDGESFVISGLVSQNLAANADKIPGLGSIPIIGAFFKSTSYTRDDSELIMVVTPHVVQPLSVDAETPALPGAEYDGYRPGSAELLFYEHGQNYQIRTETGFSR